MATQPISEQVLENGQHQKIPNGTNEHHFDDDDVTSQVIAATGPKANSRLASIVPSLTKHLHAFMRESHITNSELMAAFDLVRPAPS